VRHVGELGQTVVPDRPGEPELTQLVPQRGLVERAGGLGLGVELLTVQRGEAAVGAAGHVRDQDVRVQLRVAGAGGAVPERRRDEPAARQPRDAVLAAADLAGLPLQISQRRRDGGVVRPTHLEHQLRPAEREQQRHPLRRGERQVVARQPIRPAV
jgi:hypothetical protein